MSAPIRAWVSRLFENGALPVLILTLVTFAAYSNIYHNAFFFDDESLILRNNFLRSWDNVPSIFSTTTLGGFGLSGVFYRPLQILIYVLVYQLSEVSPLSPFGFHLLNVTLHAANAVLVYLLGRRLSFNNTATFFAALLWTLHPIHTEAITYMSGTADPLSISLGLSALIIMAPTFTLMRVLIACPFFVLALLAKESAVVIPALAVMTIYALRTMGTQPKPLYRNTLPLWVVMGVYLVLRFTILNFNGTGFYNDDPRYFTDYYINPFTRILTCLATLPHYIGLLLYPHDLHLERHFPITTTPTLWVVVGGMMALGAAAMALPSSIRRWGALSWGIMWAAIVYAPQTGIIIPVNSVFLEHWMYWPTIGLFLGVAEILSTPLHHPRARIMAATLSAAIACIFAFATFQQNKVWKDSITFHQHIIDCGEPSVRAYNNLGRAYIDLKEYDKALEVLKKGAAINDTAAEIHVNIGFVYTNMPGGPFIKEARAELLRSLEIDPTLFVSYSGLAYLASLEGKKEEAGRYLQKAIELNEKYSQTQP